MSVRTNLAAGMSPTWLANNSTKYATTPDGGHDEAAADVEEGEMGNGQDRPQRTGPTKCATCGNTNDQSMNQFAEQKQIPTHKSIWQGRTCAGSVQFRSIARYARGKGWQPCQEKPCNPKCCARERVAHPNNQRKGATTLTDKLMALPLTAQPHYR